MPIECQSHSNRHHNIGSLVQVGTNTAQRSHRREAFPNKLQRTNNMVDDSNSATDKTDIQAIQAECSTMISLLKDLEKEEHDLQCQLDILAKEALLCGFQNDVFEPPIPRKRTKKQAPKEDTAKKE